MKNLKNIPLNLSEKDKEIIFDAMKNQPKPNENLIDAYERYRKKIDEYILIGDPDRINWSKRDLYEWNLRAKENNKKRSFFMKFKIKIYGLWYKFQEYLNK